MKFQATTLFSIYMSSLFLKADNNPTIYQDHNLRGIYCSFSSASWFIYDFTNDSTFEFRTEGHFGRTKTRGSYIIDKDSIRLTPFSKEHQPDSFYFRRMGALAIKNDSCLITSFNELHCKMTSDGWCYPGYMTQPNNKIK